MTTAEKKAEKKVRVKSTGDWPSLANSIVTHYEKISQELATKSVTFEVPMLPKSMNHYKEVRFFHGKRVHLLHDDVGTLRTLVNIAMKQSSVKWQPTGITAVVILFCSPVWLTKKRTVRTMDVDNLPKTILDAIQLATGAPDELHWNVHAFKVLNKQVKTVVHLFDLGDIVEYME